MDIENGTPQDSFISPVLFFYYYIFLDIGCRFGVSLFADDGVIWKRGCNVDFILTQIQLALEKVVMWASKWGFRISVEDAIGNKCRV